MLALYDSVHQYKDLLPQTHWPARANLLHRREHCELWISSKLEFSCDGGNMSLSCDGGSWDEWHCGSCDEWRLDLSRTKLQTELFCDGVTESVPTVWAVPGCLKTRSMQSPALPVWSSAAWPLQRLQGPPVLWQAHVSINCSLCHLQFSLELSSYPLLSCLLCELCFHATGAYSGLVHRSLHATL
jgi:hypothetical protein